jgi:hypothetical protein
MFVGATSALGSRTKTTVFAGDEFVVKYCHGRLPAQTDWPRRRQAFYRDRAQRRVIRNLGLSGFNLTRNA